jgi:hypothetical protein
MIGLLFRIGGDSSPLKKELEKTKVNAHEAGQVVGKEFATQFKGAIMSFIGAGAIVGFAKKTLQEALRIDKDAMRQGLNVEAFQELERAASAVGMTVEELREAAPMVADSFTKLLASVRESGGILDAKTVQQLADAAEQLKSTANLLVPIITEVVKYTNYKLGQMFSGFKAAAGAALVGTEAMGGGKAIGDIGRSLVESGRTTARDVAGGGSTVGQTRTRAAAMGFRSALERQRFVSANREAIAGASLPENAPFVGSVFAEMVDAMKESVKKTGELKAVIEKKL